MSTRPLTCADVERVAPELALGSLTGNERATALMHLEDCPLCRQLVDDLAAVADELLLLAPEAEPPIGFETRTAARIAAASTPAAGGAVASGDTARRPRQAHRLVAAAAVAFLLGAAIAGGIGWWAGGRASDGGSEVAQSGPLMRTATVRTDSGYSCHAVAIASNPAWIYMSIRQPPGRTTDTTLRVEAVSADGKTTVALGTVQMREGRGALGAVIQLPVTALGELRVYDASGKLRYDPDFSAVTGGNGPTTTVA